MPPLQRVQQHTFIGCRGLSKIQRCNTVGEDRSLSGCKGCCATCWKEGRDCLPGVMCGEARALMKFVDVRVVLISLQLPGCRDAAMTDALPTVHWHRVPKIHDCSFSSFSDISIIEVSIHTRMWMVSLTKAHCIIDPAELYVSSCFDILAKENVYVCLKRVCSKLCQSIEVNRLQ